MCGVKIVLMCYNNRQLYLHVTFHDHLVMWYKNEVSSRSKKLLVMRQRVVHIKNVGM